jgi:biopolymer transport protein ExbB
MNNRIRKFFGGVTLLASVSLSVLVQAQGLTDVLNQARATREAEIALFQQRADEYNAMSDADKQAAMQRINQQRAAIQTQVDAKTQLYSDNDLKINQANSALREKASALGVSEIFGLARQVAGDSITPMEQSLINAQFSSEADNRISFFESIASSERVLTSAQLERVWFEISREMAATGQIAKYTGAVVEPNGTPRTTEVIRIGAFNAIADGQFLSYIPELGRLNIMPRQPVELLGDITALASASSGYVTTVVDSTRGVLLNMYVERPTFIERIVNGEKEINFTILAVGLAGTVPFIVQLFYLIWVRLRVSAQMRNMNQPNKNNALGRVLLAFKGDGSSIEEDAEIAELRISEAVMREVPKLERFQPLLRLVVAAGPLLGLVGTVIGMILTFQSITESGSSDPKLMANGIGTAMIATLLGLGIAVPMLFANALLNSLSRGVVQVLDEQSAGMLAEKLEKRKHG